MKKLLIIIAILVAAIGGYKLLRGPPKIPAVSFTHADGKTVSLDEMYGGKDHLLVVFLFQPDPSSDFALTKLKEVHSDWASKMAFVGFFFGTHDGAAKYVTSKEIPFPVYGLQSAADPYAINEMINELGSAYGMRDAIYGGTVVVVDTDHRVQLKLEKEELRDVTEALYGIDT